MIPKIIHYVWLGKKEMPKEQECFISNWKKLMPDYQIIKWDENNFDVTINNYCKSAYEKGKFAFASDYIRLYVLKKYGGFYLDTDIEIIKSFDDLLDNNFLASFENKWRLATCVLASETEGSIISDFLKTYDTKIFHIKDNLYNLQTINSSLTSFIRERYKKHYLINKEHVFKDCHLFEMSTFSPIKQNEKFEIKSYTYTIHHFNGSWTNKSFKKRNKVIALSRKIIKDIMFYILGDKISSKIIEKNYIILDD